MLFDTSFSTATIETAIPESYSDFQLWHLTYIERYSVLPIIQLFAIRIIVV
jgi:hypothetical protein